MSWFFNVALCKLTMCNRELKNLRMRSLFISGSIWSRGYKTFFMPNSTEHEILNAHKYKKYQEVQLLSGSDKPRLLFFLLIDVKMPTVVGILTFMSRKNFMFI